MAGYNKTYIDRNKPFCGWYYDDQQNIFSNSRLLTVSLHANSVPLRVTETTTMVEDGKEVGSKKSAAFKWLHCNTQALRKGVALLHYPYGRLDRDNSAEGNKKIANADDVCGYFLEPLCTCFTNEDFNITVSNNYQQAGGDVVEQVWNQIKPFAPMAKKVFGMGQEVIKEIEDQAKNPDNGLIMSTVTNWVNEGAQGIVKFLGGDSGLGNISETIDEYLNKSLILNGARFSYYGGTNLGFNNLGMKFTIFPKWYVNSKNEPVMLSVLEQVEELLPYVSGQYTDWNLPGTISEKFDGVLGWNSPPGDFRANSSDVDLVQKGTLKLKIGSQYSLTNLVIETASFNFSKQMVKNPAAGYVSGNGTDSKFGFENDMATGEKHMTALSPLYCEVTLQLRPITKYTSQMLERFINGVYNEFDRDIVYQNYSKNLVDGKKDMIDRYKTKKTVASLNNTQSIKTDSNTLATGGTDTLQNNIL